MLLQFVIQVHYMQNIEQLSLVLMQMCIRDRYYLYLVKNMDEIITLSGAEYLEKSTIPER